jgi:hypothetical protein
MQVYRLEHPVYGDPNQLIGGIAEMEMMAEIRRDVRPVFLAEPHHRLHRFQTRRLKPQYRSVKLIWFNPLIYLTHESHRKARKNPNIKNTWWLKGGELREPGTVDA